MRSRSLYFFLNDTATTKIYTLSLHDALPIYGLPRHRPGLGERGGQTPGHAPWGGEADGLATLHRSRRTGFLRREPVLRSEEHTSELQSRQYLVCRLLLEKKKKIRARLSRRMS